MAKATGNQTSYVLSYPGGIKVMQNRDLGKVAEKVRELTEVNKGMRWLFVRNSGAAGVLRLHLVSDSEVQAERIGFIDEVGWPESLLREIKARGIVPTEPRGEAH